MRDTHPIESASCSGSVLLVRGGKKLYIPLPFVENVLLGGLDVPTHSVLECTRVYAGNARIGLSLHSLKAESCQNRDMGSTHRPLLERKKIA